jgi:uncharacterized protein YutE (UPF0331/DUF86 family)
MQDDVIINKVASIERAERRAREEYESERTTFIANRTRFDAAVLNVQRACETAIDLAQHVVRTRALGVPTSARDLFTLLAGAHIIDTSLALSLQKMVDFRNIAVHEYQRIDAAIVVAIIETELDHILAFATIMLRMK